MNFDLAHMKKWLQILQLWITARGGSEKERMEYKHFNHEHNLAILELQAGNGIHCSGCRTLCSDSAYACWKCDFFLHLECGNANRAMEHPSHELHHLTLVPYPTYSAGSFVCNACGAPGSSFSYCCSLCEFDLHIRCALLPAIISHRAHPHELSLTYGLGPQAKVSSPPNACDICHKLVDNKFWTYSCGPCKFQLHTSCATPEMVPISYQADGVSGNAAAEAGPGFYKEENGSGSSQNGSKPAEVEDPVLATQLELMRLQQELELSNRLAKMMASYNLSSLV